MAATVTSAWAKPGAWALDSEEHEEELKQETTTTPTPTAAMSDFPDLMTAAATKTKKKKGQTISLGEFVSGKAVVSQSYQAAKGLTAEDIMMLPTGPRQRTAEELDRTRLGGGFRSYGNDSSNSRWGSGGGRTNGGDDEGGRKSIREPLGPSRADEIDDWGAAKKSSSSSSIGGGFDRRERGGSFFEGSNSRADESDSWGSNKKPQPFLSDGGGRRMNDRDRDRDRRMGFESSGDADISENWGRKKEVEPRRFGAFDSLRERRPANANANANDSSDSDAWGGGKKRGEVTSRPKLNLQPRKIPIPVGDVVVSPVKPKGSNPFGDARPREHVLKEKGEDWKEMDQKLEAMKFKDLASLDPYKRIPKFNEDSTETKTSSSWRKNLPPSGENNDFGHTEEAKHEPEEEDAQK